MSPTVLTETETVEVLVPVDTPLPEACFSHHRIPMLDADGPLTLEEYVEWVDGIAGALLRYRQQTGRCRELNQRRVEE